MIYASIIVEAVRARPGLVFWLAALMQAALWLLVPALVYSAPPGDLANVLAIGHEMRLGTAYGPPLAYWLAEFAFDLAGGRTVGPYLLSQLCVLATLWSVLVLGRDIVGLRHAVLAVLLLVGVSALSVATPDFGPAVLAMPLWSITLLHAWRAVGQADRRSWFVLSITLALLLLTSYIGLVLLLLLDIFLLTTRRGRTSLRTPDPWLCTAMVAVIVLPYAVWLSQQREILRPVLTTLRDINAARDALNWGRLLAGVLAAHTGAFVLVALASGWPFDRRRRVPEVEGGPRDPLGRRFLIYFAVAPALATTLVLALFTDGTPLVATAPLVVLSGLAIVAAAGVAIRLHRQRILAFAWLGLLFLPPAIIAVATLSVPRLLPIDLPVAQPAKAIGRYFSDVYARRTGRPLAIVAGDQRLASLIAVTAASRPRLFISERATPWLSPADIRAQGAIIVWPATDTRGTPPADVTARFPDLVLEVPHTFERVLRGFGAPLRVGWAMIRPVTDR